MLTADLPEILPSANCAVIVKSLGSSELSVHSLRRQAVPSSAGAALPAGVGAALAARQQDHSAEILLVTDELCEPYEKPPLSKAVLTGKYRLSDLPAGALPHAA